MAGANAQQLFDGTRNFREDVIGFAAYQLKRADHDYEYHGQHHCVFSDILSLVIVPHIQKKAHGRGPHIFEASESVQRQAAKGILKVILH